MHTFTRDEYLFVLEKSAGKIPIRNAGKIKTHWRRLKDRVIGEGPDPGNPLHRAYGLEKWRHKFRTAAEMK